MDRSAAARCADRSENFWVIIAAGDSVAVGDDAGVGVADADGDAAVSARTAPDAVRTVATSKILNAVINNGYTVSDLSVEMTVAIHGRATRKAQTRNYDLLL